jgi:hypothetical protein
VLRALVAESGETQTALARTLHVPQQLLSHHLRKAGDGRCSPVLRARLARHFGVAEAELGGEPVTDSRLGLVPDGYEFLYSARTRRAASRLFTRIDSALAVDLTRASANRPRRLQRTGPPDAAARRVALGAFADVLRAGLVRQRLLLRSAASLDQYWAFLPLPERFDNPHAGPNASAVHEAAMLGILQYWEYVLTPWFDGECAFSYRELNRLTHPESGQTGVVATLRDDDPWNLLPTWADDGAQP